MAQAFFDTRDFDFNKVSVIAGMVTTARLRKVCFQQARSVENREYRLKLGNRYRRYFARKREVNKHQYAEIYINP